MSTKMSTNMSGALLAFLEEHPGDTFTAQELWERVPWPGRIYPSHVQQALERRLFPDGLVVADGNVSRVGKFLKATPDTRWCVRDGAPAGFLVYDLVDGICEYDPEKEWR